MLLTGGSVCPIVGCEMVHNRIYRNTIKNIEYIKLSDQTCNGKFTCNLPQVVQVFVQIFSMHKKRVLFGTDGPGHIPTNLK